MTCMVRSSLHDIGKQRHEAGALDRVRQGALVLGRDGGDARRNNLAALGNVTLQQFHVLVVDLGRIGAGERGGLVATEEARPRAIAVAAASAFTTAATAAFAVAPAFTVSTKAHCAVSSVAAS